MHRYRSTHTCPQTYIDKHIPPHNKSYLVVTGKADNLALNSIIGKLIFNLTTSVDTCCSVTSGRYFPTSVSNCSRKIPSSVILPLICLSAEHETPVDKLAGTRDEVNDD